MIYSNLYRRKNAFINLFTTNITFSSENELADMNDDSSVNVQDIILEINIILEI